MREGGNVKRWVAWGTLMASLLVVACRDSPVENNNDLVSWVEILPTAPSFSPLIVHVDEPLQLTAVARDLQSNVVTPVSIVWQITGGPGTVVLDQKGKVTGKTGGP